jgi:hypothetical protein
MSLIQDNNKKIIFHLTAHPSLITDDQTKEKQLDRNAPSNYWSYCGVAMDGIFTNSIFLTNE